MTWPTKARYSSALLPTLLTWTLAAALTTGCGDKTRCEDSADSCDPPSESGLVVNQIDAYYTRKGLEHRPRDFGLMPIELIPSEGGEPVSATGLKPGQIRFDVPPGSYLLKYSNTRYILTSARTLDLGDRTYGRPERGGTLFPATKPQPVEINVSGLEPVFEEPSFSSLTLASYDLQESGSFNLGNFPSWGQTSVAQSNAEYYSDWGSIPRFDPAHGDRAWVLQMRDRDTETPEGAARPWTYETVARAALMDPFSFNGGTMSVQATLKEVPAQQVRFDLRRDEFDTLRTAYTPISPASVSLYVYPALKDPQDGWIDSPGVSILSFLPPRSEVQTPLVRALYYGNPFPSPWEPVAQLTLAYSFTTTNHDGSRTVRASESFVVAEPPADFASAPIRPRISQVTDFKVDGISAKTPQLLGSAMPLVTWEPPALGTVEGYVLQIEHWRTAPDYPTTVARIYTGPDERSVRLPPGLLTAGNEYVLRVTARTAPGTAPGQTWFRFIASYSTASIASSLLTVK